MEGYDGEAEEEWLNMQLVMFTLDVSILKSEFSPTPVNVTPDIVRVSDCVTVKGIKEEVMVQSVRLMGENLVYGERWSDGLDRVERVRERLRESRVVEVER